MHGIDWWHSLARRDRRALASGLEASLAAVPAADPAFICRLSAAQIGAQTDALASKDPAHPLFGVPFAIKDNIDVAGLPTTAACPEFAYAATDTAPVVERLMAAGAILVGKTNLDQFATGLVGTRSPYGVVPNPFHPAHVCGGSSSGSASLVARDVVPFALGTDTAGSGRVPAAFTATVGLKPTRGWLSTRGIVPACRSLDCASILAQGVDDAALVAVHCGGADRDAYSRPAPPDGWRTFSGSAPRLGLLDPMRWFGDEAMEAAFGAALERWRGLGAAVVRVDSAPLWEAGALLYDGPWVAERYEAVGKFLEAHPGAGDPIVRRIILDAKGYSAADAFRARYRLRELRAIAGRIWESVDALCVPTAPVFPTLAEVAREPLEVNRRLGTYTNFVNLLDWAALALPAGKRPDGLPFGLTLVGPAWSDAAMARIGQIWEGSNRALPFAPARWCRIAVVGAHLRGMALNGELLARGARFLEASATSAEYRLYALAGTVPPRPGLVRTGNGAPIEVEIWELPAAEFGRFVAGIPPPLGLGTIALAGGGAVQGFLCEAIASEGAEDITRYGGWRAYVSATRPRPTPG